MRLIRVISGAETVRRGWGFAYHVDGSIQTAIAPIPLNIAIAWGRHVYRFLLYSPLWVPRGGMIDALANRYRNGFEDGQEAARRHYAALMKQEIKDREEAWRRVVENDRGARR